MGKTWFVKYAPIPGKLLKRYGKLNDLTTLEERLAEGERLIKEINEPSEKQVKQKSSLVLNLEAYLECKRPEWEERSFEDYRSILRQFTAWYYPKLKTNKHCCPSGFISYLFDEGYSKNYIRKNNFFFKAAFKWLVKEHLYHTNVFSDITVKKVRGLSKLPFTAAQKTALRSLIEASDKQLWLACELEYYCFIRPKELRLIKLSDIDSNMMLWIRAEVAKDDDAAPVIIPAQLIPKIKALKENYPAHYYLFGKGGKPSTKLLSKNSLNLRHSEYVKALNLGERYSLYSWVHTGIKEAALSKLPVKFLQQQKRHHSLDMFNQYLKDLTLFEDCIQMRDHFPTL